MSSAAKTLELLSFFTTARPQIGLSRMCKLARRDKATTYRHLRVLQDAGFLEQDQLTKQYRLGPVVLQLAKTRETTFPRTAAVEKPLYALAEATGETAHVTVLSGETVYALSDCESQVHSTRAIVDIQTFSLHATASGLCALAYGPANLIEVAAKKMETFTASTVQSRQALSDVVQQVRETGFARSNRSFEDEIYGIATPIFDESGKFAGSVSVASVATRFGPEQERLILEKIVIASREITRAWGGVVPRETEATWTKTLSETPHMEPAS
ncbi:IclR family transcriptional regulator [Ruegeria sp. EL01]|jgi:DNA-binding IclR family transcriptional regulator|uniref:IclR family transcriptional regulator n=1 Tax=Ruegeria sp. EL01 TaxID=2107578 RepID=UPI000EA80851|nr:IclR family transcriptional regulator [Ruegeria sp. EL01]